MQIADSCSVANTVQSSKIPPTISVVVKLRTRSVYKKCVSPTTFEYKVRKTFGVRWTIRARERYDEICAERHERNLLFLVIHLIVYKKTENAISNTILQRTFQKDKCLSSTLEQWILKIWFRWRDIRRNRP